MALDRSPIHSPQEEGLRHKVKVIEDARNLTPEMLQKLVDCAEGIFNTTPEEQTGPLKTVISSGGKIYYVVNWRGQIIAYTVSEKIENSTHSVAGFYFSNGVVRKKYRKRGIFTDLNRFRLDEVIKDKGTFIRFWTQNPIIELGWQRVLERKKKVYPYFDYCISAERTYTNDRRPVTNKGLQKSGVKEIDDRYEALDYENGEMFMITISLEYK